MTRCYLFFLFFFTSPIFSSFLRSLFLPLYLSSSRQIFSSFKFAETRIDRQFAKIQFSMGLKLGCSRGKRKSAQEKKIYKKIYSSTRSEITTSLPKSIINNIHGFALYWSRSLSVRCIQFPPMMANFASPEYRPETASFATKSTRIFALARAKIYAIGIE